MKRAFDVFVSALALLLLWPVFVAITMLIRRSSDGGALHIQVRVGLNEKPFILYKFRTMVSGAPILGTNEIPSAWITTVGQHLRVAKLDELPQLYNVLKGDMSLVGPRPCLPTQIDVVTARRHRGVFRIRPGITGEAQLKGIDMSTPTQLAEADRLYVMHNSFLGDLSILLQTIFRLRYINLTLI